MRRPILGLLGLLLLFSLIPPASQAKSGPWSLQLLEADEQHVLLELTLSAFHSETVIHDGVQYQRLRVAGWGMQGQPGQPQLPMHAILLGMPRSGSPQVSLVEADSYTVAGRLIHPAPALALEEETDGPHVLEAFAFDADAYSADTFYPGPLAEATPGGWLRDQPVSQLRLSPFQYNPLRRELRVYRRLVVRVTFPEGGLGTAEAAGEASPAFQEILERALSNYDTLPHPPVAPSPSSGRSPIIVLDTLTQVKLMVEQSGLYRVTYADLQAVAPALVQDDPRNLELSNRGTVVPILFTGEADGVFGPGDSFIFYGQAISSDYTRQNVYWLKAGSTPGLRMSQRNGAPGAGSTPASFADTRHYEQDKTYWQALPNGEGKDHWFWDKLTTSSSTPAAANYIFNLQHIASQGPDGQIRVMLQGATFGNHLTQLYLNGVALLSPAEQAWSGKTEKLYQVSVPQSRFVEGNNQLRVENILPSGVSSSEVYVNWFEATYQDTYIAENNALVFSAPSADSYAFALTGFTTAAIELFDVTNPAAPVRLINYLVEPNGSGYRLRFNDSANPTRKYLAQRTDQLSSPVVRLDEPSAWKSPSRGATFLVVTHPSFYDAVQPLASYRRSQGETVAVAKTEDIYDEFNDGIYDPQAIRSLLAYAYANWSPKPVYVLLVGDASQDPKNNLGGSLPDLLPAYYVDTPLMGQTPTDAWYVKVHGDDDYPDLIVGRIPARAASEVTTVGDKVQTYEQSPPPGNWIRRAVLVADDGAEEFYKDMDAVASLLPAGTSSIKMYGYDPTTSVQAEVNQGALLLAYSGHGGYSAWGTWSGGHRIFDQTLMQNLSNGNKLPFMTVANCVSGFFATYDRPREMAEEFLLLDNKGGIASWAPASYGFPTVDTLMQQELYTAIFEDGETTLGSAATTARIQGHLQRPDLPLSLIEAFNYFGDPAVTLNILPPPATLALAGQDLPDPVTMGNVLTFTLTYTVAGTSARGLTLVNTLPQQVIYQSASPPPIVSGQVLTWSLGDMSPGSGTIKIVTQVKTNGLAHGQVLNNQARLYDADSEQVISLQTTVRDSPIVGLAVSNTSPTQLGNLTTLSATVAAGTNVAYTWNFGDGSPPSSGAQVQHTYPTIGTYTARAIATNGVSSQDQSTIVTLTETPIAGLAASNNSPTQLGHLTTLSATVTAGNNVDYTWNFGDGSPTQTGAQVQHTYLTVGVYTARVIATNGVSSQDASTTVTITEVQIAGLSASNDSPTQLGYPTTLSATVTAGTNVAFTWNLGDGSPSQTGAHVQHTYPNVGTYIAHVIATNGVSSQDASTTVIITEVPVEGLSARNTSPTQLGHLTMLSATVTAGTDVIYTWDLGDGAPFQAGPYVQHAYPAVGTYIACVTATNRMNSQTQTTTVTITEVPIAGLAVSNTSPQELGSSIRLWADVITGTNVVYTWDVGDGTPPQTGASVEHVYPAVGAYTAYVTATNRAGSQVQSTTVTVTDIPPIARFVSSSPNRQNQATIFQSFSAGTNLTYEWDFGDGSPPVSTGTALVTHTFAALGTFTAVLTASNSAGRSSVTGTVEIIVAVRPPVASFNSSSPDELGQTTAFINTSQAGGDDEPTVVYAWDLGDGEFSSDKHPVHIYATSGSYTVQLTITNSVSCDTYSDTVLITDAPIHGLAAQNTSPTWLGNATALSATVTAGTNVVYTWNLGDGSPPQTGAAIQHTYPAAGIFTAWVTATNGVSSQTQSTTVTIADVPIGSLWAGNDSPTPLGSPTTLSATVKAATGVTYIWDLGDGAPLQTGAQIQHTYSAIGTFSARVTAVNGDSSQSQNTLVSIIDVPIAGLSASNDSPTLPGHVTTLSATVTAGTNVVYTWNFGDGSPPQAGVQVQHIYSATGTYIAQVIATNGASSQSQTIPVTIIDVPIVGLSASNDSPTLLGRVTTLSATVAAGTNVVYIWNFGDGSPPQAGTQVQHTYLAAGTYAAQVIATNSADCQMQITLVSVVPVSIAGLSASNTSPTLLGEVTTLSATVTAGTNVVYIWNFADGSPPQTGALVQHTYPAVGDYEAQVIATNGDSSQSQVTLVSVVDVPIVGLVVSNTGPTPLGDVTTLSATVKAGTNVVYTWNFGDGSPLRIGALVQHTYPAVGDYEVQMVASNGAGSQVQTTTVVITEKPLPRLIFLPVLFKNLAP